MSNQQQLTNLIKSISGQANILTIPRVYISFCGGDLAAALLLSQNVYWSDKSSRKDGGFWKTYDEWEAETGLSRFQVKRAAALLMKMGFLQTKVKRANSAPTMHYFLDIGLFTSSLIKFLENRETSISEMQETRKSDMQETRKSLTETTTSTTTPITKSAAKPAAPRPPKPSKPIDPLLEHPAVKAYRGIAKATPNQQQRQLIADSVTDVQAWEAVLNHWMLHGWNKLNVQGIIDSYENGGASTCNLCKRKGGRVVAPAPDEAPAGFVMYHAGDPL